MCKKERLICYSDFYCTECGEPITLARKTCSLREKYHIKDIFCYKCKEVTHHIEVRQQDYAYEILNYFNNNKDEILSKCGEIKRK